MNYLVLLGITEQWGQWSSGSASCNYKFLMQCIANSFVMPLLETGPQLQPGNKIKSPIWASRELWEIIFSGSWVKSIHLMIFIPRDLCSFHSSIFTVSGCQCPGTGRHKRNWKIVFLGQVSLVQHNLLLSLSALISERENYPRLPFCLEMRPSLLVWQKVSQELLSSIVTSSRGWFTQDLESGCGLIWTRRI